MTSTKEYTKYQKAISKVADLCQKFADKHGIEFIWAANY
jgi:predicted solute-binding protein